VVDLADGGVLAEQQPVSLAQLGDVAHEQHPTGDLAGLGRRIALDDRDAPAEQVDLGALLELLDHGHPALVRLPHRAVVETELRQTHPERARLDADAVEGRVRVG
jgi:hypothetical protein